MTVGTGMLALFVPRASPVHRAPAGGKLLALAGLAALLFAVPTLPAAGNALAGVLLLGAAGRRAAGDRDAPTGSDRPVARNV